MRAFSKNTDSGSNSNANALRGADSFFGIQRKLSIGKQDDAYEKEADSVADKIIEKTNQTNTTSGKSTFFPPASAPLVQKSSEEEVQKQEETGEIQEKPISESITPVVQLAAEDDDTLQKMHFEDVQQKTEGNNAGHASSNLESNLSGSRGGGAPLASESKDQMESGFGADFSNVRIHNDSNSVQMNKELGSQAFASGNDIYFNEGKYNPGSKEGQHLLAHELTHTVQQGASAKNTVQKVESPESTTPPITEPTTAIDITTGLSFPDEWLAYIDANSRQRKFMVNVKIGDQYSGIIALKKVGRTVEGEPRKFELNSSRRENYLNVGGMNFLNPLRNAGVHPILVLNQFGEGQQTSGFLSIRKGEEALTSDVLGVVKGINENLEAMSFLGLSPIQVAEGLENNFTNGGLNFSANNLSLSVDGYLDAQASIGITNSSFTFEVNSTINVAGLAEGELQIARGEDGGLSGNATINADIANVSATIQVAYDRGAVTIQGTGRMNSEKFSGEITLLVTDEARSTQMMHAALGIETMDAATEEAPNPNTGVSKTKNNQVLAAWGEVQASITPWLEGTAKIGIDHEGHVTIVGEIIVPNEIELMEQRGKKVDLFNVEIRAGYGIPLVGQVFLFAGIGMFVNAGFGPLVLKNVGFTGTYSTDPDVLQQFSITGTLGINAFAIIGLEAEAGVGVTIIGHDIKAGVNVTAAAGIRAYAEATPTFEYTESQSPEGGKIGESHLRGHFEAAAQLFLQLSGALFYELDSPWWSPAPDGREELPLGEVQYPIGDSLGIGADIDWLVGSPDVPELTFSPVEFDPDKFTADVMADPPPRTMGNADAEPEGEWTGEPDSDQNINPEITGEGEGLPPNSRREEDLSKLPDEQKYMRALDELSRLEEANPKPTIGVVEAEIRKVKRKYGITKIETRNEEDNQVSIYVEHAQENNSRHLLNIPLMSQAERLRLLQAAMEALRTSSRSAADAQGKITRSDAEQVLTTLKRNHPVIVDARVVEGQNTWDYLIDIGNREETKTGEAKKETEINGSGDFAGIDEMFTTKTGDSHKLYIRESSNGDYEIIIESTPTIFEDFITQIFNRIESPTEEMIFSKKNAVEYAKVIDRIISTLTSDKEITKEDRDQIDQKLSDLSRIAITFLNASTISPIPSENIIWGGKIGGFGSSMAINYLSSKSQGAQSSNKAFKENKVLMDRKTSVGGIKYYSNGHLLNANLHGPDDWINLAPINAGLNAIHKTYIEQPLQNAVPFDGQEKTKAFKYIVIVEYSRGVNSSLISQVNASTDNYVVTNKDKIIEVIEAERFVPTAFIVEAKELEDVNGHWQEKSSGEFNIPRKRLEQDIGSSPEDYKVTNDKAPKTINYSEISESKLTSVGFGERGAAGLMAVKADPIANQKVTNAETLHIEMLKKISGPGQRTSVDTIKDKINF